MIPQEKISLKDSRRYQKLKQEIHVWCDDRFRIGAALREIQESRLYLEEYDTFDSFCMAEFSFKRRQAYRLIEAVAIKESVAVSPIGDTLTNEGQARALAIVPPQERVAVLAEAAKSGTVTAKSITTAAKNNGHSKPKESAKPEQPLDKTGYPIPAEILEDWHRAEELDNTILKPLHKIKLMVGKAKEGADLLWREITPQTTSDLQNTLVALKCLIPYAVCPTCNGHNRKRCTVCKQRGFVSKFAYEHWFPKEILSLREKGIKK